MNLKTFFILFAVVGVIFGLGSLIIPEQFVSSYGVSLGEPGKWVARYFGATLIGFGVLSWGVRNVTQMDTRNSIVLGLFLANLIGLAVAIFDVIDAAGNWMDWINLIVNLFFALGFGYFRFMSPNKS